MRSDLGFETAKRIQTDVPAFRLVSSHPFRPALSGLTALTTVSSGLQANRPSQQAFRYVATCARCAAQLTST